MPTYVMLANWTDQGARQVTESPKRVETARRALTEMGGELKLCQCTPQVIDILQATVLLDHFTLSADHASARREWGV